MASVTIANILRRLAWMILVVWLAVTLAFFALRILPGDAIQAQLVQTGVGADVIQERRAQQGLTDSLWQQYGLFLLRAIRGDLGFSLLSYEPVGEMIVRDLRPTLSLAVGALVLGVILALVLGIGGALNLGWGFSTCAQVVTSLSLSTPIYWTGTLAIYLFTAQLGLLPSAGAGRLSHLVLPVSVLAFHTAGAIARVIQANVIEALQGDFVRTARGKGLSESSVIIHHVLRVGLVPVLSVVALQAGFLLSGTVIIETLFVRPGIGRLLLSATIQQDYPVVQGIVILSAVVYTALNTTADVLYRFIDPRIV